MFTSEARADRARVQHTPFIPRILPPSAKMMLEPEHYRDLAGQADVIADRGRPQFRVIAATLRDKAARAEVA